MHGRLFVASSAALTTKSLRRQKSPFNKSK